MLTVAEAQAVFKRQGGYREQRAPVALLDCDNGDGTPCNIASAFDAEGAHIADIAWRPHRLREYPPDGLLLC